MRAMTRLVFAAAVAAAVFGAACEKSKGSSEEAPIQKGSTPKPLPPPPPKEEPKADPAKAADPAAGSAQAGGAATDPAAAADPSKGGEAGHTDGDGHDHGGGGSAAAPGPGGAVAPTPPAAGSAVTGAALPMDTVRPPEASDLAAYTKDLPGKGKLRTVIETSMGKFNCELFDQEAPITVANWIGLATGKKPWTDPTSGETMKGKPFYNGIIFHRVIPGFMIQGGDPLGKGIGGPGYNFGDEVASGRKMNEAGLLAMANAGPGTNGSQFFITEAGAEWLTGRHTIFGKCAEVDLVKKITGVPRDPGDRPNTPVTIKKVTVTRK